MIVGKTEARAQLSSTIIDYHEPFDQGFRLLPFVHDVQVTTDNLEEHIIFILEHFVGPPIEKLSNMK